MKPLTKVVMLLPQLGNEHKLRFYEQFEFTKINIKIYKNVFI